MFAMAYWAICVSPQQDNDTLIKEGSLIVFPLRMKVKTDSWQQDSALSAVRFSGNHGLTEDGKVERRGPPS